MWKNRQIYDDIVLIPGFKELKPFKNFKDIRQSKFMFKLVCMELLFLHRVLLSVNYKAKAKIHFSYINQWYWHLVSLEGKKRLFKLKKISSKNNEVLPK